MELGKLSKKSSVKPNSQENSFAFLKILSKALLVCNNIILSSVAGIIPVTAEKKTLHATFSYSDKDFFFLGGGGTI